MHPCWRRRGGCRASHRRMPRGARRWRGEPTGGAGWRRRGRRPARRGRRRCRWCGVLRRSNQLERGRGRWAAAGRRHVPDERSGDDRRCRRGQAGCAGRTEPAAMSAARVGGRRRDMPSRSARRAPRGLPSFPGSCLSARWPLAPPGQPPVDEGPTRNAGAWGGWDCCHWCQPEGDSQREGARQADDPRSSRAWHRGCDGQGA